jgi:hypothetical protein
MLNNEREEDIPVEVELFSSMTKENGWACGRSSSQCKATRENRTHLRMSHQTGNYLGKAKGPALYTSRARDGP